jgi:hypothetical protein
LFSLYKKKKNMSNLIIANTIWKQICAGEMIKVWSWGVPLNSRAGEQNKDGSGSLHFKVNGQKFKGTVIVKYRPVPDDYVIEFVKIKGTERIVEHTIEDVYCDQLTELIDEYVEKIPAYKR